MAVSKKPKSKKARAPAQREVKFSVKPGTKVQISIEAGAKAVKGKVPITIHIEQITEEDHPEISPPYQTMDISAIPTDTLKARVAALKNHLKTYDLTTWLFIGAVIIYLGTRLIGLTRFPIYFFTDEAIQTQSVIDLIKNGYRDSQNIWFPTYFRNGDYYNLSLSVYLQWLPYLIFGKSAFVTRAVSIVVSMIAAISVGIILRDIFKIKYWWTGTLFISITPAWFLHSRTAFETVEFVALYAGTLCAYLFYRYKSPRSLYLAIFLGALAFYSYSPAQLIVPLTAIGLLLSDWKYHWENRRTALIGLVLVLILALPYMRFRVYNPSAPFAHLHTLWSYWFEKISLSEKVTRYLSEFGIGLSPWYWYIPNDRDLSRHLMKDYGNIMIATLPLALFGMAHILRNLRLPACRAILIALLISPAAAALVNTSITRTLVFIIPAGILTSIGLDQYLQWLANPTKHLRELGEGAGPNTTRLVTAALILFAGISISFISREPINRIAILGLAIILALQVSGILERLSQSITHAYVSKNRKSWNPAQTIIALSVFAILSGVNIAMLRDALRNGPLWFRDYGMGGMQYGAFQIFDIIEQYARENPDTQIIFSPDWTNGADVVTRFFMDNPSSIQIGSIRGHITQKLSLEDAMLFIMTPEEYDMVINSAKLTDINVEREIPYPDGNPGFYFVRLRYVKNIDEIFASEKSARQALRESTAIIDGQEVKLRYSYLDTVSQAEAIALVFDNDPYTLAKTFESNPFIIELTFPTPRQLNGFSIIIGSAKVQITLKCFTLPNAQPSVYVFEGTGTEKQPELSFDIPHPVQCQTLRMEVLDLLSSDQMKMHIWELKLR